MLRKLSCGGHLGSKRVNTPAGWAAAPTFASPGQMRWVRFILSGNRMLSLSAGVWSHRAHSKAGQSGGSHLGAKDLLLSIRIFFTRVFQVRSQGSCPNCAPTLGVCLELTTGFQNELLSSKIELLRRRNWGHPLSVRDR